MTVDTARLLARYNTRANAEMNQILATLTPEEWDKDRGGYFPSFRALVGHIYTADVHWLVRFTGHRPYVAARGPVFDFPPSFAEPPFVTLAEYLSLRPDLDARLEAFTAELTDADLAADLSYRNSRGEPYTRNLGGLVVHLFNHATHHRGSVSYLLDQMGQDNDYSNVVNLL